MQTRRSPWTPLLTALWVGMTGSVLVALVDNLPLLTEGNFWAHAHLHLLAAALVTVFYAVLLTVPLGTIGLLLTALLAVLRRPAARPLLLSIYTGLLSAAVAFASWWYLYGPAVAPQAGRLPVLCAAGLLAGAPAGGLIYGTARSWERGLARNRAAGGVVRWSAPVVVLLCVLLLLGAGIYRNVLRSALPPAKAYPSASPERPNILLITVDSLRADHLGIYGYDPAISPNIDALAHRGVYFRQAIAQSSWTLPSVASMITGLYSTELGIYAHRGYGEQVYLDPLRDTLAEALRDGGYYTGALIANPWINQQAHFDQGFDYFSGIRPSEPFDLETLLRRPLLYLAWKQPLLHKALWWSHYLLFDHRLLVNNDGLYQSIDAKAFLEQHRDKRFFLWLYYMEPHSNYTPSAPFPSLPAGNSEEESLRLQGLDYWLLVDGGADVIPPEQVPALVSLYDGEIHDVDLFIGAVLDELDRLNLSDRTLVVLHSDHGEEFYDHGGFAHGSTFYEELVRVPLIIAGPGIAPSGRGIDAPVALLDLLPTLLETAGAAVPPESRGRSLWPLLHGAAIEETPIYMESLTATTYDRKAVRYQGWKLVYGLLDERVELYDLRNDPREQRNLAADEPERAAAYLRLLRRWMAQAVESAERLPRSLIRAEIDERVRAMLREGGY